jgi:hypothetical protein
MKELIVNTKIYIKNCYLKLGCLAKKRKLLMVSYPAMRRGGIVGSPLGMHQRTLSLASAD